MRVVSRKFGLVELAIGINVQARTQLQYDSPHVREGANVLSKVSSLVTMVWWKCWRTFW
jgi:hypothetical protein